MLVVERRAIPFGSPEYERGRACQWAKMGGIDVKGTAY
jgi:hypothetical protein